MAPFLLAQTGNEDILKGWIGGIDAIEGQMMLIEQIANLRFTRLGIADQNIEPIAKRLDISNLGREF